ncbi:hypothetical protein ABK040_010547 [Willaertia magna]
MIPQQNEISSPPFKKIKLPIVNNNTTLSTTKNDNNNKETSSVIINFVKLNQFELFKILSFLTNERNSILKMLCLNKTIFNEIFNENNLQENIKHFILGNENIFVTIILSILFNYKLNLFVNNEIYNNLQKQFSHQPINKDNIFITLHNYLNNNNLYNEITENIDFYCNDGEEQFSNDTMIYRKEDDNEFSEYTFENSSLQNENYLLFSNLKNTLNRLRIYFDFLTYHIQSLQSYVYKRKQWSTWLNEINVDNNEILKCIQHELNTKIFDKVNFVKSKKSDMFDLHICIAKYKIGKNLEFKYSADGNNGNPYSWILIFKINNDDNIYNDDIFTLIDSDTDNITIKLQNLEIIKTILQIDNNLVSNELLIEAILISCPQWNILKFIEEDFNITKIDFDNEIITTTYSLDNENDDDEEEEEKSDAEDSDMEDSEELANKTITMEENKFTITDLPFELLNYICNYLFYLKDGLSFCLTSKEIYNAIYYNNNLFIPNKIIKDTSIPLITTTIYNEFKQQKVIQNKECDRELKCKKNKYYFDLTFNDYGRSFINNYYFKLFLTNLERIEHFIGYVDSLQRFIYVKQFEFNNFLKEINNNYIAQQLNDKIFKKLIYQSSQINAIDSQWHYKAFYNVNNCIYFTHHVHVSDFGDLSIIWFANLANSDVEIEIRRFKQHLLEKINEKQLRKYLDLEDKRVTIDLICKCLQYCSPFKYEMIKYFEEHIVL